MAGTPIAYNPTKLYEAGATTGGSVVQPVKFGYDIEAARISALRRERALKHANGTLSTEREKVVFFVTEFEEQLGLTGTYGQGRKVRDLYPHNIVLPVFTVTGVCLDQWDYGNVVEFVHASHQESVGNSNLLQLDISAKHSTKLFNPVRPIMRGAHKHVRVQGFVEGIERTHAKFKHVPVFKFSIAVAYSLEGIYTDAEAETPYVGSWWELLEKTNTKAYNTSSLVPKKTPKNETAKGSQPTSNPTKKPGTFVPAPNLRELPEEALEIE